MNFVFWLAIIVGLVGVWAGLRYLFKDIGTIFLDIAKEITDPELNQNKQDKNEKENKY